MDQHPIYLPAPPPNRSQTMARALALGVLVGLILLVTFLGYEFFSVATQNNQLKAANASLQQKVDKLNKQVASGSKSASTSGTNASTGTSASTGKTCNASTPLTTIAKTLKDTIASYVSNEDYDSLQSYMADQVNVVIAGQEKGGNESSDDAVSDMAFINSGTTPWNFSIPTGTTDVWRAHTFQPYFTGNYFAGEAADNVIVSFQFDGCSKINTIFMASDPSLVEQ
jgi:hypothetical protein